MNATKNRYQLEFRLAFVLDWRKGSCLNNLLQSKTCVDVTLYNNPRLLEGRIFDNKLQVYRYYHADYFFKS